MNKKLNTIAIMAATLLLNGCYEEEVIVPRPDDPVPTCKLQVAVDWANLDAVPDNASLWVYPANGATASVHTTNNAESFEVELSKGSYNFVLHNGKQDAFYTVGFRGMGEFETAEVYVLDQPKDNDLHIETIAAVNATNFLVTEEMVTKADAPTLQLKPVSIGKTTAIKLKIDKDIDKLEKVKGSLKGMVSQYFFADAKSGSNTLALNSWDIVSDPVKVGSGWIETTYTSFGLANKTPKKEDVKLELSFKVKGKDTLVSQSFEVGDQFDNGSGSSIIDYSIEVDIDMDEVVPPVEERTAVTLNFTGDNVSTTDIFGLTFNTKNHTGTDYKVINGEVKYDGKAWAVTGRKLLWYDDKAEASYYAYAPYNSSATTNLTAHKVTIASDQSSALPKPFLYGKGTTTANNKVNIAMKPQMAKLGVSIDIADNIAGETVLESVSISNCVTEANFNLRDGSWNSISSSAAKKALYLKKNSYDDAMFEGILIPQTISRYTITVKGKVDGVDKTYSQIFTNLTVNVGSSKTIELSIGKDGIKLNKITIGAWNDVDLDDAEFEM